MSWTPRIAGALGGAVVLALAGLLGGGPLLRALGLTDEVEGLPAERARASFIGVGEPRMRGFVPGEVIVRFDPGTDAEAKADARATVDADLEEDLPLPRVQLLEIEGTPVQAAVDELEDQGQVAYAEPNFYRSASAPTSDRYFGELWGLENTGQTVRGTSGVADADADVPEAWDRTTGDPGITTAVIDTGVDLAHGDLSGKIWRNPDETGGGKELNGVDDDRNGYVDDWRGWDWVRSDNNPSDGEGHGTHVAGTIAARADDRGVVGVNRDGSVMALRVLDSTGSGTVADVIKAYKYARSAGAEIVNASLGSSQRSQSEYEAIEAAPDTLFVVAAGNGGTDGIGDDVDLLPEYPCSYDLANIVCVAATNQSDHLALFSNYGASAVDLSAPGVNVLSDYPGGGYAYSNGTSMATPHVAGAAGLVWAARPGATPAEVKQALLASVDPLQPLSGRSTSGGRLNAAAAVATIADSSAPASAPADDPPSARPPSEALVKGSQASDSTIPIRLAWSGTDDQTPSAELEYDLEQAVGGGSWRRVASSTGLTTTRLSLAFGTGQRFRVRALDGGGKASLWATGPAFTPSAYQETFAAIIYRGSWRRRDDSSALGGRVRSSRKRGSTATVAFKGRDVGVVMPRRSKLGKAQVCLDPGTSKASCEIVDLSPSNGLGVRRVIFTRGGLVPTAKHKLRVKVRRGRVDLDALVVLR